MNNYRGRLRKQYYSWLQQITAHIMDGSVREWDIDHWLRSKLLGEEKIGFLDMPVSVTRWDTEDYVGYLEQVREYMLQFGVELPEIINDK